VGETRLLLADSHQLASELICVFLQLIATIVPQTFCGVFHTRPKSYQSPAQRRIFGEGQANGVLVHQENSLMSYSATDISSEGFTHRVSAWLLWDGSQANFLPSVQVRSEKLLHNPDRENLFSEQTSRTPDSPPAFIVSEKHVPFPDVKPTLTMYLIF
jgi:hypothetical protein